MSSNTDSGAVLEIKVGVRCIGEHRRRHDWGAEGTEEVRGVGRGYPLPHCRGVWEGGLCLIPEFSLLLALKLVKFGAVCVVFYSPDACLQPTLTHTSTHTQLLFTYYDISQSVSLILHDKPNE